MVVGFRGGSGTSGDEWTRRGYNGGDDLRVEKFTAVAPVEACTVERVI